MFRNFRKRNEPVRINYNPYDPRFGAYYNLTTASILKIEEMLSNDSLPAYERQLVLQGLRQLKAFDYTLINELRAEFDGVVFEFNDLLTTRTEEGE